MPIAAPTKSNKAASALLPAGSGPDGAAERLRSAAGGLDGSAARAAGMLGLTGTLAACALISAGSAGGSGVYLPGNQGIWPEYMNSPLRAIGLQLSTSSFQSLTLLLIGSYALVLIGVRRLSWRAVWLSVVAVNLLVLLGAPLLSRDIVGYLSFARLGFVHGLDPYTHTAAQASGDPLFALVGWPHQHTPYGPLFTLISYAFAPLGILGGLWGLRLLSVAGGLLGVWLLGRSASAYGRDRAQVLAFAGLNPALLELALGGFHNDTLVFACTAAALALLAGTSPRYKSATASLVAAVAIKISAALALLYLLASPNPAHQRLGRSARAEMLMAALVLLAVVAALAFAAFGGHALGFLGAIHAEQQIVSPHSLPAQLARWSGLSGTPAWWRELFVAAFAVVAFWQLVRTVRGADWLQAAGWSTLALVLGTAWLLPWYVIWILPFAALSSSRALRVGTLLACLYALSFHLPLAGSLLGEPAPAHTPAGPGFLTGVL